MDMWSQSPTHILVMGHGAAARYPENTMLSFQKAAELGVDGIEMDLNRTSDGCWSLFMILPWIAPPTAPGRYLIIPCRSCGSWTREPVSVYRRLQNSSTGSALPGCC